MKEKTPQTTEELYEMLQKTSDLAGKLELVGESIFWTFQDFWILASLDENEGYIAVNRNKKRWWQNDQLLHWHPRKDGIYEELCAIGNKNNVCVIRNAGLFSNIFYCGKESAYPYTSDKKWHWGKLYYLKPQD